MLQHFVLYFLERERETERDELGTFWVTWKLVKLILALLTRHVVWLYCKVSPFLLFFEFLCMCSLGYSLIYGTMNCI